MDIAVIGVACRFPGAVNVEEFWRNLADGKCAVGSIPKNRWDHARFYDPDHRKSNKTNGEWGGFIEGIDRFDPLFFHMSGREAELSDPHQRLFLEESWRALEDAGYADESIRNPRCGVFAGVQLGEYHGASAGEEGRAQALWGSDSSITAARVSYFFNLKGPGVAVNTAQSSSLAAVHMACRSIRDGECDTALAGGVFLMLTPRLHLLAGNAGMLSPDGRCKAFDRDANGFVPGEGVGVVLLKPLQVALEDHDHIRGVIRGSGVNQDGRTRGLTTPGVSSQTRLHATVYERFNLSPRTIQYVEAHGSGTPLGDPIEMKGLLGAFQRFTRAKRFCAVGSVKTNIGHLMHAAGIAGFIKALLALEHKKIPPSLHFFRP
ncbi:MAG: polyketide synthase, partial [Desulfobacterales bacterium]|nr:polyketide synthase [Desulfobacterales bacterium]